jgi:hypothetical protein
MARPRTPAKHHRAPIRILRASVIKRVTTTLHGGGDSLHHVLSRRHLAAVNLHHVPGHLHRAGMSCTIATTPDGLPPASGTVPDDSATVPGCQTRVLDAAETVPDGKLMASDAPGAVSDAEGVVQNVRGTMQNGEDMVTDTWEGSKTAGARQTSPGGGRNLAGGNAPGSSPRESRTPAGVPEPRPPRTDAILPRSAAPAGAVTLSGP